MDELDVAARVLAMAVDVNAVEDMQDEVHLGAQAPHVPPTPAFEPSYGFEVSNADAPVSQKVEAAPRIISVCPTQTDDKLALRPALSSAD